jgi:pimeloyl-ACP methyl ester carboxylesterase
LADDVKLFLDAVNLPKVTILATCMGGYVGTVFACRNPNYIENLILMGAVTFLGAGHLF